MVPVDIKNGNPPDAPSFHEVWLTTGILSLANFHKGLTTSNNLLNNSSGYPFSLSNGDYLVDGFGNEIFYDSSNTTCPVGNDQVIRLDVGFDTRYVENFSYNCKLLDRFDNSSVDSGIWSTTGTVTEDSNSMNIALSSSSISDGVSGLDLKSFSNDTEVIIMSNVFISGLNSSGTIQVSNGSTHITLHDRSIGGSGSPPDNFQDIVRIKFDDSTQEVFVSVNGAAFGSAIDISSVTTNWYIRFIAAGASATMQIHNVGFLDGASGTVDYQSVAKTFKNTKTDATLVWDYTGSDSDIAGSISSNSGTNFTSADKNVWTTIGTQSTAGVVKLTMTLPTVITATSSISDIEQVKAVGAYFDG